MASYFCRCFSGNLTGVEIFLISVANSVVNVFLSCGLNVRPFIPSLIRHCEPANSEIRQRHPPCKASFVTAPNASCHDARTNNCAILYQAYNSCPVFSQGIIYLFDL